MNTRKLMLTVAAVVAAGTALAQPAVAKTRAEVRAEAVAALQAGEIQFGDAAVPRDLLSVPSQRSRAEVHAQAVAAANQAHAGVASDGDNALPVDQLRSTASTLSRAQVRAEAIEAVRLGLTAHSDAELRLPTPAEQESIRQAGLRAIGIENVSRR